MRHLLLLAFLLLTACGSDEAPEVEIPSWAKVAPEQIAEAKRHGVPVAFENELQMRFVLIPSGTFLMGSPEDEEGRRDDETQHEVTISQPFYMQTTEVTLGQYRRFQAGHKPPMGNPHDGHRTDDHPTAALTALDAGSFAAWLTKPSSTRTYRLPSEAEWEYACRAGSTALYSWGASRSAAGLYANVPDRTFREWEWVSPWTHDEPAEALRERRYFDTKDGHVWPAPVTSFQSNAWGLYDMIGNVEELCTSNIGRASYVVRGGFAMGTPHPCRCASRRAAPPENGAPDNHGFRLVSPLPE